MAVVSLPPVVTAQYYGDSGGVTQYWYWVQAVYPWGNSPLSSAATVTVLSLSHSNVVSINWTPPGPYGGAIYYNVWRTTTSAAPTTGTNQCIAQALPTVDGLVDNGIVGFTIAVGAVPTLAAEAPSEADAKGAAERADKEAKAANDKLMKQLEEDAKKQEKLVQETSDQARILNQAYNEKFALPVRETEAQKNAREAAEKESKSEKGNEKKAEPVLAGKSEPSKSEPHHK